MPKYSVEYYCYATHIVEAESPEEAFELVMESGSYPVIVNVPDYESAEIHITECMGFEVYDTEDPDREILYSEGT